MSLHSNLLCRNGCGFYGNPEWQWFCSKCWREHQRKSGRSSRFIASPEHQASALSGGAESKSPIKKVPAKDGGKTRQTIDKNIKQLFGARMTNKDSPEKSLRAKPQQPHRPEVPKEAREVSNEFAIFLNQKLARPGISDVSKCVKGMAEKIARSPISSQESIDELSANLQDFYQFFQSRLEKHQLYKGLTDEDRLKILDLTEKYITISCYKQLFCPNVTNDEDKDLELQNQIRCLNWISTEHLNCSIDEFSQEVRDLLYQAINDLLEIDGKMAPQDKMASLVKCSKSVFEMLKLSSEAPASADDFLPCLIYICLKANPPRIQSNINFITRFCNENKLRMGEGGYFFANLCCALSFIENLTAHSINMDPEEFESYISGKSIPLESWRSNLLMCDGLQKMSQNLKVLSDLKSQQEQILDNAKSLQEEMEQFQAEIKSEVDIVLARTAYTIKPRSTTKEPVDLDAALEPLNCDLPAPLIPDLTDSLVGKKPDVANDATLEDYFSASDNMSLLSLDLSGQHDSIMDDSLTLYRGFSAQSSAIPSISCVSAVPRGSNLSSVSSPPSTSVNTDLLPQLPNSSSSENLNNSTASSSPMISAPTSPDEEAETKKKTSSSSSDEEEPVAVKVLSGLFETFDGLL